MFRFLVVILAVIICIAILFPFRIRYGPIGIYYRWEGSQPFYQIPWAGGAAPWFRFTVIMGAAVCVALGSHSALRVLIICAGGIAAMAVLSSSPQEVPLAIVTWLPFGALLVASRRQANVMAWIVLALLAIQLGVTLIAFLLDYSQYHSPGVGARASGLLGTPNGTYPLCLVAFLAFHAISLDCRNLLASVLAGWFACLALVDLYFTYSRMGWIGLAAGIICILTWNPRARFIVIVVGFAICAATLTARTTGYITSLTSEPSAQGHWISVREGLNELSNAPLLGRGPHAFARSGGYQKLRMRSGFAPYEPKNQFVHVAIEYGILGAMLYVAFAAAAWVVAIRCARATEPSLERSVGRTLACAIPAIGVAGLGDTPIFANLVQLPATLALVVFAGFLAHSQPPVSILRPRALTELEDTG